MLRALLPAVVLLLSAAAAAAQEPVFGGSLEDFLRFRPVRPAAAAAAPVQASDLMRPASAEDAAALSRVVRRMLRSPLARELAAEFAAHGTPVLIGFDASLGTRLSDGTPDGTLGVTWGERDGVRVKLAGLLAEPAHEAKAAGVLAHELLGHGNRRLRAGRDMRRPGLTRHSADESLARVLEFIVLRELGEAPDESEVRALAADADAAEERRAVSGLAYQFTVSAAQMSDPVTAYRRRSQSLLRASQESAALARPNAFMLEAISHFVSDHGEDPASFAALRTRLERSSAAVKAHAAALERQAGELGGVVDLEEAGQLQPPLSAYAADAAHPVVLDTEARLRALLPRAASLLRDRPSAPAPATQAASPIAEQAFLARIREDASVHPDFWRAAAATLDGPAKP